MRPLAKSLLFSLVLSASAPLKSQEPAFFPDARSPGLSFSQAVQEALQTNVDARLARADTEKARAESLQAAASLLPDITGSLSEVRTFKENLVAEGFPASGLFNPILGPFNTFDARIRLTQKIFDWSAEWSSRMEKANARMAAYREDLARDQVASAAALAYVDALQWTQAVQASQADVDLAGSMLTLAQDQRQAGLSTGIDVARAETRLSEQNVGLVKTKLNAQYAIIRLSRIIGWPMDRFPHLTDSLEISASTEPDLSSAMAAAGRDRVENRIVDLLAESAEDELKAAQGGRYPSVKLMGDYGMSGVLPKDSVQTGSVGAELDVPVFNGGFTEGRIRSARSAVQQADVRRKDTSAQIEEDLRIALETMAAVNLEEYGLRQTVLLAERELHMAQDRFKAGVGDNIQVLSAQASLAQARQSYVEALARCAQARVNLAMALGRIQSFKL